MAVYDANPQEMARRTRVLEEVSDGVDAVFDDHNTRIERIGDVWGTDEMGEQFFRRYGPSRADFDEYSVNLSHGVRSSVDAVVETATRIQVTEHDNTEHGRSRPK